MANTGYASLCFLLFLAISQCVLGQTGFTYVHNSASFDISHVKYLVHANGTTTSIGHSTLAQGKMEMFQVPADVTCVRTWSELLLALILKVVSRTLAWLISKEITDETSIRIESIESLRTFSIHLLPRVGWCRYLQLNEENLSQVILDWCKTGMPIKCLPHCYWTIDDRGFSVANSAFGTPEMVSPWETVDQPQPTIGL